MKTFDSPLALATYIRALPKKQDRTEEEALILRCAALCMMENTLRRLFIASPDADHIALLNGIRTFANDALPGIYDTEQYQHIHKLGREW